MGDFIIITGDKANFNPAFGAATVTVMPGTMSGSGPANGLKQKICVEGDEKNVVVPGCAYVTPVYITPGTGTLKIDALGGDQKTKVARCGGKPIIIKGSQFTAKFEVTAPAQQPTATGPVPDTTTAYSGTGMFITTNTKVKAG